MINFLHKLISPFQKKQQKQTINQDHNNNEQLLNYQQICVIDKTQSQKWLYSTFNKTSNLLLLANHTQIKVFQFKSGDLKYILTCQGNKIEALHSIKNQNQYIFMNLQKRQISSFIGMNNCKTLTIDKCFQRGRFQSFLLNKNEDLLIEYGDGILIFQQQNSSWKFIWYGQCYSNCSNIHLQEDRNILICKADFWKDGDGLICIYQKIQNEIQDTWECIQNIPIMMLNSICYISEHKIIIISDPKRNLKFYKLNMNNNQFEKENDNVNIKIQNLTFRQHDIMIDFNGMQSIVGIEENKYFISAYICSNPVGYYSKSFTISNYGEYIIIHSNKQSEIRQLQLINVN